MTIKKAKVLITGVTGLLGSNIVSEKQDDFNITGIARNKCDLSGCEFVAADITDEAAISKLVDEIKPNVIIHTAALTNVNLCEKEPQLAEKVHVGGTENLLKALKGAPARFIHISTDAVFNGEGENYNETDAVDPINVYGRTKLKAEEIVQKYNSNSVIIRTAFYGNNILPKKSLSEWILDCLARGEAVPGFSDIYFSPILSNHLAKIINKLAVSDFSGILHVSASEGCSKYGFAKRIANEFGYSASLVKETAIASVPSILKRPRNLILNTKLAEDILSMKMPTIDEGIKRLKVIS